MFFFWFCIVFYVKYKEYYQTAVFFLHVFTLLFCGQIYDDRGVPLCLGFKFSQTLLCCSYKNLSWETTLHSTCVPHKTFKNYLSELLRSSTYRLLFRRSYRTLGSESTVSTFKKEKISKKPKQLWNLSNKTIPKLHPLEIIY